MPSVPQTYTISDFIEWNSKKQLLLAPDFQRGSVWSPSAKVFLIDTILNDYPIPQVYFRTNIDPVSQSMLREVVDGQQRLRAILEFASGKLKLTSKAPRHRGKTYQDLDVEDQELFLSYKIPAVQLINASNADVLEIFARLNSYSVKVTPAELRHAEYSEPVKWAIYDATREWHVLWDTYKLVSVRDSVRLKNTSLIAELFMALDEGLDDGGEHAINKYYKKNKDQEEGHFKPLRERMDFIIREILENAEEGFKDTTFFDAPNFLTLFCAVGFLRGFLPNSRATNEIEDLAGVGVDWQTGRVRLAEFAQAFDEQDDEVQRFAFFVAASKSTTHRISSRKPRFQALVKALHRNVAA